MATSIVETIQRMGTALLVVPVALLGVNFLVQGRFSAGVGFLGLAALMIAISEYVTTPKDVPGETAQRVVGWIAKPPEDEE
ncbi:MAG: hypothetical protein ABEI57_00085 [Halapricum sp.]